MHQHANYKENRLLRRSGEFDTIKTEPKIRIGLILAFICAVMAILASCALANTKPCLNANKAILAIIGEGESEPMAGKIALAYTLINRETLKGCYGLHAKRVVNHLYSKMTYNQAKCAWEYAVSHPNNKWTATGWGNANDLKIFAKSKWWKNCVITARIGNHYFYKQRGS